MQIPVGVYVIESKDKSSLMLDAFMKVTCTECTQGHEEGSWTQAQLYIYT